MGILILLVLTALLLPALSACQPQDASAVAQRMAQMLSQQAYPRMYQLLTDRARNRIALVDFTNRYENTYSSFGLTALDCKVAEVRDQTDTTKMAVLTMAMTTDKLGQFDLTLEMPLALQDGQWRVEWSLACVLPGMEDGDKVLLNTIAAQRGEIFDRQGNVLAKNTYALTVYVQSSKVKDFETLIRTLAPLVGMTENDVRDKLLVSIQENQRYNQWLADNGIDPGSTAATALPSPAPTAADGKTVAVPKDRQLMVKTYPRDGLTTAQKEALTKIPGVYIDDSFMTQLRVYPNFNLAAHVLGYTGTMTEDDLKNPDNAALPKDARIGKDGLEKAYEDTLRAYPGYELVIQKANGTKTLLARKGDTDGRDLRLTLDSELQQRAELLLMQKLTDEMRGTIIVLDPKTGYIQAMASYPAYDPNLFSFRITDQDTISYFNDKEKTPLYNRATMGLYPPGSTFKPFSAVMGLEDGKITANTVFSEPIENNYWKPTLDGWVYPAIKRYEATPAPLNLRNAITHSDNIFFAYTALKVGSSSFYQHCESFGLSQPFDFDLPVKTSQIANNGVFETMKVLADSGYGQGQLLVTPLQMATLFASLANGGDIMLPRLVQSVCHTEGTRYIADETNPAEIWKANVISKDIVDILVPDLKNVVLKGTAKALGSSSLRKFEICAKTGTAEVGNDKTREIAWIIGFTTAGRKGDDRLVCVTLEVPAQKGDIRASIAAAMFEPTAQETATWAEEARNNGGN